MSAGARVERTEPLSPIWLIDTRYGHYSSSSFVPGVFLFPPSSSFSTYTLCLFAALFSESFFNFFVLSSRGPVSCPTERERITINEALRNGKKVFLSLANVVKMHFECSGCYVVKLLSDIFCKMFCVWHFQ